MRMLYPSGFRLARRQLPKAEAEPLGAELAAQERPQRAKSGGGFTVLVEVRRSDRRHRSSLVAVAGSHEIFSLAWQPALYRLASLKPTSSERGSACVGPRAAASHGHA